jgi:SSS family solute:Na+ symporter
MLFGTIAAYKVATPTTSHWAGSTDIEFGHTVYIGLSAIIINIAVSVILTLIFKAARIPEGTDETLPQEYQADPGEAPAAAPAGVGVGSIGSAGDLPRISSGAACRLPFTDRKAGRKRPGC